MPASFFSIGCEARLGDANRLVKLSKLIDWTQISQKLNGIHKNEINSQGGPIGYDKLKMFKAALLGQWHSLSDPQLEEALRIRLDFMAFCEFDIHDPIPDETTLCRFRNKLIAKKLLDSLLKSINHQLEESQIKVRNCNGAIVDATIIESASRPKRTIEVITEDRKEEEILDDTAENYEISESADPDARWLKKGKKSYFGYKGYIKTDSDDGFIECVTLTPANKSEMPELEKLIECSTNKRIYADKGYSCESNRKLLRTRGLKDGIMEKAVKGKSLSYWQMLKNKLISKCRYKVEQVFGTLKRLFGMDRARYRTIDKVLGQLYLKSMCFNLNKALRCVK